MPATITFPVVPDRLATEGRERRCTRCGQWQPLTDAVYYRRPGREFESWCRPCGREANAARRAARQTTPSLLLGRRWRPARAAASGRRFGVEIEFVGATIAGVAREMQRLGLTCTTPGYTHRVTSSWKIVTDATVSGGEVVSPPLRGAEGLAQLQTACEALRAAGARVNGTCGLHVHHDVGDLSARQLGRLFRNWSDCQRATDQLVSASRRGRASTWTQPLTIREVEHVEALRNTDRTTVQRHFSHAYRYRSLNVASYPRYGTVEVRQHQGSMSFSKIAAWVAYGQAHVAAAAADAALVSVTAHDLLTTLGSHGLTADQVSFLQRRAAHFGFAPAATPVTV